MPEAARRIDSKCGRRSCVRSSEEHVTEGKPKRLLIDTDPGVDDSMAILLAFASPEVEIEGFTPSSATSAST